MTEVIELAGEELKTSIVTSEDVEESMSMLRRDMKVLYFIKNQRLVS